MADLQPAPAETPGTSLRKGRIGVIGIVFFVIAAAAPLVGMTGAVPVAIVLGNGAGVPGAYLLVAIILLLFSVGFYLLGKSTLGRAAAASKGKASVARAEVPLTGLAQGGAIALFGGVALVAAMPALAVVLASLSVPGQWYGTLIPRSYTLDHYAQALSHPLAAGSIRNSLVLAGLAVLLAVVLTSMRSTEDEEDGSGSHSRATD